VLYSTNRVVLRRAVLVNHQAIVRLCADSYLLVSSSLSKLFLCVWYFPSRIVNYRWKTSKMCCVFSDKYK